MRGNKYFEVKSWYNTIMFLRPCPFCGGEPDLTHTGNEDSKIRKVSIRCKKCRCERTDSAIRNNFARLEEVAVKNWNMDYKRVLAQQKLIIDNDLYKLEIGNLSKQMYNGLVDVLKKHGFIEQDWVVANEKE